MSDDEFGGDMGDDDFGGDDIDGDDIDQDDMEEEAGQDNVDVLPADGSSAEARQAGLNTLLNNLQERKVARAEKF